MGGGLSGIGGTETVTQGDVVTEEQLQLLIGLGRDPVTGEALGRAYPVYRTAAERSADRRGAEDSQKPGRGEPTLEPAASADDQAGEKRRRAVAGYDFTFSIPKSASVLWGIGDATTQQKIAKAHHTAIAEVLGYMEREVAATRTGATAHVSAVAQVDVTGLIATAFDHFDSRAGDPHLHTHVVISNKVQTVLDGKWRSLDGRPMHEAVVALSELHETLFADELTRTLGVRWEQRERGRDRHPAWAISGVPEALVTEFSSRSRHIDVATDVLIEAYKVTHGRRPNPVTIMKLRAQATLSTRPAKQIHSLTELTAAWRERARQVIGPAAETVGATASATPTGPILPAEEVPLETVQELGVRVMTTVSEKRTTWRHWNLTAEAARQTMRYRFLSASDREAVVGLIVDAAVHASLRLTPPELAPSPPAFQRDDGTSVFRPRHSAVFTSTVLLDAETRLLARADDLTGPRAATASASLAHTRLPGGGVLAEDQSAALTKICESGRVVDVLVGPAGAGKTTAMNALRRVWEGAHGAGSVVGLAPSAAAATALALDLGITTENLAKWWQTHLDHGVTFQTGQLVIIDEASLAGTLPLDRVTALAAKAGAKVLLVGDYAQLQSVDAGGAFSLLVHDRTDAPELVDVHRFVNEWEKTASLGLRQGHPEVIDLYGAHDRLHDGTTETMAEAAFENWRADTQAGKETVLISDSNEAVAALNMRARTELILDGSVDALREVALHDGTRAAVGDTVITRRNDRTLCASRTWVRNGDRWEVARVHRNGSLDVRPQGQTWGSTVRLPAEYVGDHLELGYAVTSHRAQGITTDTAHVVVAPSMPRENLYVAMTRGRESNTAYVAVDRPDVAHVGRRPGDDGEASARSILFGILQHVGAELSAHETITAEQDTWGSITQLAAEYETIAAAAQHDRWAAVVHESGLSPAQAEAAIGSDAFGPLTAELRRAEAYHYDIASLVSRAVTVRGFEDAQDIAAVLRARVAAALARDSGAGRSRPVPRLVAGLFPVAAGPMDEDMRRALEERHALIEARAEAVLDKALLSGEPWTRALGQAPRGPTSAKWRRYACTVAAYRDRYGIVGTRPLGQAPEETAQKMDAAHARVALGAAQRLYTPGSDLSSPQFGVNQSTVGLHF